MTRYWTCDVCTRIFADGETTDRTGETCDRCRLGTYREVPRADAAAIIAALDRFTPDGPALVYEGAGWKAAVYPLGDTWIYTVYRTDGVTPRFPRYATAGAACAAALAAIDGLRAAGASAGEGG